MQLIGIVLLLLVGLSGSKDVSGKKRACPGYFITPGVTPTAKLGIRLS